jgi:peptide-methionine (S)-S-oxide reductase
MCFSLLLLATPVYTQEDNSQDMATAVFAGGCFWCVEAAFDKVEGVKETISGYTGGNVKHPTYEEVSTGDTGHAEAVKVTYDPQQVSYEKLLDVFWHNIDPFDANGQFCDQGNQYRSEIFYVTDAQKELAEASRQQVAERFSKDIATSISEFTEFYKAEEYHQSYYQENPIKYEFYTFSCGREDRLEEIWGEK